MADGYGNQIGYWRVHVAAWVTSSTDTTDTIHVEARWQSVAAGWDYSGWVAATVWIDGRQVGHTDNSGSKYINNSEVTVCSGDLTVSKTDNARNITCSASIAWNGFHPGTSNASCAVWTAGIAYKKPNPPTGVSFTRVDDTAANIAWKAAYDNGALKPWKQIIVDRIQYLAGATTGSSWGNIAVLNWDALNYRATGLKANARYMFAVYSRNQAGDSSHVNSQYLYTTPDAPKSVAAVKTGDEEVSITVDASNTYASTVSVERRLNDGDWTEIKTGLTGTNPTYVDSPAPGGTLRYRARVHRHIYGDSGGELTGPYTESGSVTTITPPNAPTITSPTNGAVTASGLDIHVEWTPNHPDGTGQMAWEAEITKDGGWSGKQSGTSERSFELYAGDTAKTAYKLRIRTKGLHDDWGAWSDYVSFTVAPAPNVVITGPSSINATPFDIGWSVSDESGVSSQLLEILEGSNVVLSATPEPAARVLTIRRSDYLPEDGRTFTIRLTVRGGSTLATTVSTVCAVSYTPPMEPTVTVTNDTSLAAYVSVAFGSDDGLPETVSANVQRIDPDGSATTIATGLTDGQQCIDRLPPLNTEVTYRAVVFADSGASRSREETYTVTSDNNALNFGPDAGTFLPMGWNSTISRDVSHDTESYDFADGSPYETEYATETRHHSISVSDEQRYDQETYLRLLELADEYAFAWFREASGLREYVSISQSVSYDWTTHPRTIKYSASMKRQPWKEPQS